MQIGLHKTVSSWATSGPVERVAPNKKYHIADGVVSESNEL